MSANLAMSDDLSRANAMDRPIVGPSLFPPTQSSPSQLRGHFATLRSIDV